MYTHMCLGACVCACEYWAWSLQSVSAGHRKGELWAQDAGAAGAGAGACLSFSPVVVVLDSHRVGSVPAVCGLHDRPNHVGVGINVQPSKGLYSSGCLAGCLGHSPERGRSRVHGSP